MEAHRLRQLRHGGEGVCKLAGRHKANQRLEGRQRERHLRLVVVVLVHVRPLCEQLLCQLLVRVRLD
jgi:hypothetical protein